MERTGRAPSPSAAGDLAYGIFYSGAIGGSVVALVFLGADILGGRPMFTPSFLGSVIFLGQSPTDIVGVNFTAVALFTLVHFAAFGCLGVLATIVFRAAAARDVAPTVLTALVLFAVMQGGMTVAGRTMLPGVVEALGTATVITANALTALAMALFLNATLTPSSGKEEEEAEREEELMEGPGLT